MSARQAGWYADPLDPTRLRRFDGTSWSDDVRPQVSVDRPPNVPGWFPDPLASARSRYFDGARWTDQVHTEEYPQSGTDLTAKQGPPSQTPAGEPSPQHQATCIPAREGWARFASARGSAPTPPGTDATRANAAIWRSFGAAVLVVIAAIAVIGFVWVVGFNKPENPGAAPLPPLPADYQAPGTNEEPDVAPENGSTEVVLSDNDVVEALGRAYEGFNIRPSDVDPASLATSAWLSESPDPVAVSSGNFAAVLLYPSSSDASQATEQAFLNDLAGRFRFNFPYQVWTVNQCANAVIIVADIAFTWLEPELPAGVTCRFI